ncbi:MAG: hypothetical protein KC620_13395 [Myxococcales bacterium]|nr:hypothetical protein [Myxococcales bacterium]
MPRIMPLGLALAALFTWTPSHAGISHRLNGDVLEIECQKPHNKKVEPCNIVLSQYDGQIVIMDGKPANRRDHYTPCDGLGGPEVARYPDAGIRLVQVEGNKRSDTIAARRLRVPVHANGKGGSDTICGGEGADELQGGDGDDWIYGYGGNDTIWGGDGPDKLRGGEGDDKIYGNDGDDKLEGQDGADRLEGGPGNDELYGFVWGAQSFEQDAFDICLGGSDTDRCELCGQRNNCER